MDNRKEVIKNFKDIGNSQLWDEELPITLSEYESLLNSSDTADLLDLLEQSNTEIIEEITIEDLLDMPFNYAHKCINQFSLAKRIDMLDALDTRRSYLYNQASRYGAEDQRDPDMLTPKEWKIIMGKIKHLEILQGWLYGID